MKQCVSYPGITKVAYTDISNLPDDVVYRAVAGIPITVSGETVKVCLADVPIAEVERDEDHNSYMEKAKLTFNTLEELPKEKHLAFIFRTIQGELFIIGSKERPYPTVKVTSTTGRLDGDAYVRKYEVSYMAKKALAAFAI